MPDQFISFIFPQTGWGLSSQANTNGNHALNTSGVTMGNNTDVSSFSFNPCAAGNPTAQSKLANSGEFLFPQICVFVDVMTNGPDQSLSIREDKGNKK